MTGHSTTPLLDTVDVPADIRRLRAEQLRQLADELRQETISAVSVTGGHLGAGLGVVELTVALHYVFDTPKDRLIWGRRPPGLSAQDRHGPPQPHSHLAPGRRVVGLHAAFRERIRPVWRGSFLDLDLRRPRHGRGARSGGRLQQRDRRDRRWRAQRRHGLRGDEQCGRFALAPDRGAERQRHVDRAARRRAVGPSLAAPVGPPLCHAAQPRAHLRREPAQAARTRGQACRGIRPRLRGGRHAVRRARLLLCRSRRRSQSRPSAAGAEECPRQPARQADPGPCRDKEGQGLRAGRGECGQVPRGGEVRRHHRQAVQADPPTRRNTPRSSPRR